VSETLGRLTGALADRYRGSVVTFYNFMVMALGAIVVLILAGVVSRGGAVVAVTLP